MAGDTWCVGTFLMWMDGALRTLFGVVGLLPTYSVPVCLLLVYEGLSLYLPDGRMVVDADYWQNFMVLSPHFLNLRA
jgi:hypothetical protein